MYHPLNIYDSYVCCQGEFFFFIKSQQNCFYFFLLQIDPELFSAFADYLRPDNTMTWRLWKRDEAGSEAAAGANNEASVDGSKEVEGVAKGGEGTRPLSKKERW